MSRWLLAAVVAAALLVVSSAPAAQAADLTDGSPPHWVWIVVGGVGLPLVIAGVLCLLVCCFCCLCVCCAALEAEKRALCWSCCCPCKTCETSVDTCEKCCTPCRWCFCCIKEDVKCCWCFTENSCSCCFKLGHAFLRVCRFIARVLCCCWCPCCPWNR